MAIEKSWNDGTGDVLRVVPSTGNGDTTVTVVSQENEGLDRETTVTVALDSGYAEPVTVTIDQSGMREKFIDSDDEEFLVGGTTYNVLKQ